MRLRLNLQFFAGEKTEKATPKKRKDTRKKGQVPKSTDVNTAVSLLIIFLSSDRARPLHAGQAAVLY